MKILHIGQGFIGSKLIKSLKEKEHKVDIYDLSFGDDICDRKKIHRVIKKGKYDLVVLMAAMANLNDFEKDPLKGMDVNIGGLINVANACTESKTKLLFISTCCVYGNTPDLPSDENSRCKPSEIYAAAKLAGEWIIKGYNRSYDLKYLILRIATTYGPGMRGALAPAVFINQIKKKEPITIHGHGRQTRTLTYIDDTVGGIISVINSGAVNETFNISSEEEKSVLELAEIIKKEMRTTNHEIAFVEDRKGQTYKEQINSKKAGGWKSGGKRYAPTSGKANNDLQWKAKVSLRRGIRKTLAWMKKNAAH